MILSASLFIIFLFTHVYCSSPDHSPKRLMSPSKAKDIPSTSSNKIESLSHLGERIEDKIKKEKMSGEKAKKFRYVQMVHFGNQAREASESAQNKINQLQWKLNKSKYNKSPSLTSFLTKVPTTKQNKNKKAMNKRFEHDQEIDAILNDARILHQTGIMDWETGHSIAKHISPYYPHKHWDSDDE